MQPARVPARLRPEPLDEEVDQSAYPGRRGPPRRHQRIEPAFLERIVAEQRLERAALEPGSGDEAGQDADSEARLRGGAQHLPIVGSQAGATPRIFPLAADPEAPLLVG